MNLLKGGSSLFFIISTYKSFLCSPLFFWKLTNIGFASFLYNSSDNNLNLLFMDYLMIFLVCLSYINHFVTNNFLFMLSVIEFDRRQSIEHTKNLTYMITICKVCINTYHYLSKYYFYLVIFSSFSMIFIYLLRRYLFYKNIPIYIYISLTYLLHFFTTIILYISSMTT
jgi:hypothetical protein